MKLNAFTEALEKTNMAACAGNRTRSFPGRSLVTVPAELPWLHILSIPVFVTSNNTNSCIRSDRRCRGKQLVAFLLLLLLLYDLSHDIEVYKET
jgi:hypothetical protein